MPTLTTPGCSRRWLLVQADQPFAVEETIANKHRTLGARLAGELVWQDCITKDTPLNFKMKGVAGQSFGAFAVPGMRLELEGMANDFVGKGLCGGELILRGQGRAAQGKRTARHSWQRRSLRGHQWIALCRRPGGERFAVRNSGALAVVEGIGDHGCEYMTGGLVAVLGSTGQNSAPA